MKTLVLVILALGLSTSAHALTFTVTGAVASNIQSALYDAGAEGDAGMGHAWVGGSNVACNVIVALKTTATCTANLDSASGAQVPTHVSATASTVLANTLITAGAQHNCRPGGCDLFVQSVSCQSVNDPDADAAANTCTIVQ